MKMEKAKLQNKLNKQNLVQKESGSQSWASFSEASDQEDEEVDDENASKKKIKVLEEFKQENSKRAMITTIQESENEEEGAPHASKIDSYNRGITTMSKELGRLECEDDSLSNNSKDEISSSTNSNMLKTKDSTNPFRRSSTKTKEFMRMSTLKSDSSQGSSKFKFRAIVSLIS